MGPRPEGHTLERIDNNKGYGPDNCRWATLEEQGRNKSNNRVIEGFGKSQTLTGWGRELGLSVQAISFHLKNGRSIEYAATHIKKVK
jgi:hypothetical protein